MKIFSVIISILIFSACTHKKEETIIIKEELKTSIEPAVNQNKDAVEGIYISLIDSNNTDDCKLTLELIKTRKGYQYILTTNARNVKGNAKLVTNKPGEQYVVLENLPWDEYEGDISNEEDTAVTKEVEIPTEIDFFYRKDTLSMQNYGNSMNYYSKLGECGAKYIQLVKK